MCVPGASVMGGLSLRRCWARGMRHPSVFLAATG